MLHISLRGQWKENKLSRVGNPKLDLMLLKWIEENLIENDQSEIERYDSDDDKRDHITENTYHTVTDNLRLINEDSDEDFDCNVILLLLKIISNVGKKIHIQKFRHDHTR